MTGNSSEGGRRCLVASVDTPSRLEALARAPFDNYPVINGRWRSGQEFPRWIALGDRFREANLNPDLARLGQKQTQGAVSETGRSTRRRWAPGMGSESAKIIKGRSTFR